MDFRQTSLSSLAELVRTGECSARELAEHSLRRIEALDGDVRAFVAVDGERALGQAALVDQKVADGVDPGRLAGVPMAVKDLEDTEGYRTTFGSVLFANAPPRTRDSAHVQRLKAAGAVVVGKTNTPELGWSAHTVNMLFGATHNPWNLEHAPGGSSGGAAAALAAGMVPLATGSDGGGSIRIPSACCGLAGMKASLGRVPMGDEEPPAWPEYSTRGPMARRIADVITALDVVVGPEPTDLRSLPRPEASWLSVLPEPRVPMKIAWSPTLGYAEVDAEVLALCERALLTLESLGAEVVQVAEVFDHDPVQDWLTMVGVCSRRDLEPMIGGEGWDRVDPVLAAVVEMAGATSGTEVLRIMDEAHRMNHRLVDLFHDVRLLVTPTTAAAAPPLSLDGAGLINGQPDLNWVKFTYPFNMTRSPAATVPVGLTSGGLPVGMQLVGPSHGDLVVLRSAAALEAALGFEELAGIG